MIFQAEICEEPGRQSLWRWRLPKETVELRAEKQDLFNWLPIA
jgi:hypothetical protein